jgi:hypothetical protein
MAVIATPKEVLLSSFVDPHGPMRIRIQHFISMRIQIQGAKPMRIRILVRLSHHKKVELIHGKYS